MTDLTEHLASLGPDLTDDEVRDRWRIDNDDLAGWALRKLAAAQAEQDRIKRLAEAELARIHDWQADATRQVQRDVEFFTARLVEYRRDLEARDPSLAKTYKLPNGSLARRAGRESTRVTAEDSFVSWALDNQPDALTYKPKVSALAGYHHEQIDGATVLVSDDGEVVPGVEVVRGEDRYEVRPAAPSAVEDMEPF